MNKVNEIIRNESYLKALEEIEKLEKERIFCKHNMEHFLSVARIMEIENCKRKLGFAEEILYAAALLHDIGRHLEYQENIPHEKASYELAKTILADTAFTKNEKEKILKAIASHRNQEESEKDSLAKLLYKSDKKSRPCFTCPAKAECNWPDSKKNLVL